MIEFEFKFNVGDILRVIGGNYSIPILVVNRYLSEGFSGQLPEGTPMYTTLYEGHDKFAYYDFPEVALELCPEDKMGLGW